MNSFFDQITTHLYNGGSYGWEAFPQGYWLLAPGKMSKSSRNETWKIHRVSYQTDQFVGQHRLHQLGQRSIWTWQLLYISVIWGKLWQSIMRSAMSFFRRRVKIKIKTTKNHAEEPFWFYPKRNHNRPGLKKTQVTEMRLHKVIIKSP